MLGPRRLETAVSRWRAGSSSRFSTAMTRGRRGRSKRWLAPSSSSVLRRSSRGEVRREALQCRRSENFLAASRAQSAFCGMPGLAIRADVLREAGGFRQRLRAAEDQDLCLRLGEAVGFVQIDAPILFFQRTDLEHLSGHVGHAIDAVDVVIEGERRGSYPGGTELAGTRRAMICALARRTAMMCSRAGEAAAALRIYRRCFGWHVALQRWRFLLGFPLLVARSAMRRA